MQRPTHWLRALALLSLLLLAPGASAEGLVQFGLLGEIEDKGGAWIEIEVAARAPDEGRVVEIGAHFARGTTARDLIDILAHRLERSGIVITFLKFMAYGVPTVILTLAMSHVYIMLRYY